jgi:hypothetical protein
MGKGYISKKGQTLSQGGGEKEDDRFASIQLVISVKSVKKGKNEKRRYSVSRKRAASPLEVLGRTI